MPLPNTRVIPDGWDTHHRGVPEGTMTATCDITDPAAAATYDETTLQSTYDPAALVYQGPCRVLRVPIRAADVEFGGRQVVEGEYQVTIPIGDTEPAVGHLVKVTAASKEARHLVGKVLRVVDVRRGSLAWEQVLRCTQQTPAG